MSSDTISIRVFEPGDQEAARTLILEGLGEHFGYVDETRNPDLDDINDNYGAKGNLFIVAEHAGMIIGTGALVRHNGHDVARLVRISVSRAWRREGVGKALVEYLVAAARAGGFGTVLVETNLDWLDAIGLYTRAGFMEYDRDNESVYLAYDLRQP